LPWLLATGGGKNSVMREQVMRKYVAERERLYPGFKYSNIQRQHKKCWAAINILRNICDSIANAEGKEDDPLGAVPLWKNIDKLARQCEKQISRYKMSDRVSADLDRMTDYINKKLGDIRNDTEETRYDKFQFLTIMATDLFVSAALRSPYFSLRDNGERIKAWDQLIELCWCVFYEVTDLNDRMYQEWIQFCPTLYNRFIGYMP
jgi:hypothetical protein